MTDYCEWGTIVDQYTDQKGFDMTLSILKSAGCFNGKWVEKTISNWPWRVKKVFVRK